jgi:hypothetical protein
MSTEDIARRIVIVDCEASCLPGEGRRSYPIEIAAGVPETAEVRIWLIKPARVWLDEWDWYQEAEQLHRLTRNHLLAHGLPRLQVARELKDFIGDREVVSDNPAAEGHWLAVLYGEEQPRRVGSLVLLYAAIMGFGKRGKAAYQRAEADAYRKAPPTHRAGDDVRHELVKLNALLQLMDKEGPP